MDNSLISGFLGRNVTVRSEGYTVSGRLCSFSISPLNDTYMLVLYGMDGFILTKNFEMIGEIA